jgi:hypothetical protein
MVYDMTAFEVTSIAWAAKPGSLSFSSPARDSECNTHYWATSAFPVSRDAAFRDTFLTSVNAGYYWLHYLHLNSPIDTYCLKYSGKLPSRRR